MGTIVLNAHSFIPPFNRHSSTIGLLSLIEECVPFCYKIWIISVFLLIWSWENKKLTGNVYENWKNQRGSWLCRGESSHEDKVSARFGSTSSSRGAPMGDREAKIACLQLWCFSILDSNHATFYTMCGVVTYVCLTMASSWMDLYKFMAK